MLELVRELNTKLNIHDKSLQRATKMLKRKYQKIPILEENSQKAIIDADKTVNNQM